MKINDYINFKATDVNDNDVLITENNKIKVLSLYPAINTTVCDLQTQEIVKMASKHTDIEFISISLDKTENISKWCASNSSDNVKIISDLKYKEFSKLSGLKLPIINMLKRGLIVLDNSNKIIDINITKNIKDQVDFIWLENILNKISL